MSNKLFFENCAVYEIMWGKKYCTTGQATDDNTLWRMSFSCCINKTTNTH